MSQYKKNKMNLSEQDFQGPDEQEIRSDVNKNTSAANTSQENMTQVMNVRNQVQQNLNQNIQNQPQPNAKKEFLNTTQNSLDNQFKDALSYFGPRMAALLFGGNDAMAMTDQVMRGFEGYEARRRADRQADLQAMQPQQKPLAERKFEFEKKKFTQQQQEKATSQIEKDTEKLSLINDDIAAVEEANKLLSENKDAVGYFGGNILTREKDMLLDSEAANRREDVRFRIDRIIADDTLDRVAKMKGALSNKELSFVRKPAPTLRSSPTTIKNYLNRRTEILKNARKRLGGESVPEKSSASASQYAPGTVIKGDQTGTTYVVQEDGSLKERK